MFMITNSMALQTPWPAGSMVAVHLAQHCKVQLVTHQELCHRAGCCAWSAAGPAGGGVRAVHGVPQVRREPLPHQRGARAGVCSQYSARDPGQGGGSRRRRVHGAAQEQRRGAIRNIAFATSGVSANDGAACRDQDQKPDQERTPAAMSDSGAGGDTAGAVDGCCIESAAGA